jgi:PleD family two-component response regulator
MPMMMTKAKKRADSSAADLSVVLASDSMKQGTAMHRALQQPGVAVEFAGDYAQLQEVLRGRRFDVVLLEVTGEHAVEPAVEAALRIKRGDAAQFVGYLADAHLDTRGLAGDAVLPRIPAPMVERLRRLLNPEPELS